MEFLQMLALLFLGVKLDKKLLDSLYRLGIVEVGNAIVGEDGNAWCSGPVYGSPQHIMVEHDGASAVGLN